MIISLDDTEKLFVKKILQLHLDDLEKGESIIISEDFPTFLAAEEKYKEYLIRLIGKF